MAITTEEREGRLPGLAPALEYLTAAADAIEARLATTMHVSDADLFSDPDMRLKLMFLAGLSAEEQFIDDWLLPPLPGVGPTTGLYFDPSASPAYLAACNEKLTALRAFIVLAAGWVETERAELED